MVNQKGFTLVEGLLIVLVLSVIGFAGYTVWNNNQDDESEVVETTQDSESNTQAEQQSEEEVALVSSASCTALNGVDTADKDAAWKEKVESSSEITQIISGYPDGTTYETYFGTECTLSDDSQLVSYSHYYNVDNGDGALELVATKGLARFDGDTKVFIYTESPCLNGPPDATSPATIDGVADSVVSVTCGGLSAEEATFSLTVLSYN